MALYIISVAAELAGVHPQTLRIYERKGLIEPQRTQGRSRRYSDRDIALLQRIQELTHAGVGLAGVERILELEAGARACPQRRIADLEAPGRRGQRPRSRDAVDADASQLPAGAGAGHRPGTLVRLRVVGA